MNLLLQPKKRPAYRGDCPHGEFLTKLKDHLPSKDHFFTSLKATLAKRYNLKEITLAELLPLLELPHRKSTTALLKTVSTL